MDLYYSIFKTEKYLVRLHEEGPRYGPKHVTAIK
jgi:hypothetical protein